MPYCKSCGEHYSHGSSGGNIFGYCSSCWEGKKMLFLAIIIIGTLFAFVWKIPKFIYGKAGIKGVLIYFAVLAGLGLGGWYYLESKAEAKRLAIITAEKEAAQVKKATIEAQMLVAKANSNPKDLVAKNAADAAVKKLKEDFGFGIFTDSRDGKIYRTTKIGNQTWLAENLNYNASGSKCYNNDPANCQKYGRLYDWNTAKTACPKVWHLPRQTEWNVLTAMVGGESMEGKFLKAKSGWNENGNGEDKFGFSALPGGYGNSDGSFSYVGSSGYWWSASEHGANNAYYRRMYYDDEGAYWNDDSKSRLLSVRCIQN